VPQHFSFRRHVIDRTGISGRFDYDLEWTPTVLPTGVAATLPTGQPSNAGPNIFTALQEQLGLKLESGKEPLPVSGHRQCESAAWQE
jgi:uncharacterized protein (TIGR03435 family)